MKRQPLALLLVCAVAVTALLGSRTNWFGLRSASRGAQPPSGRRPTVTSRAPEPRPAPRSRGLSARSASAGASASSGRSATPASSPRRRSSAATPSTSRTCEATSSRFDRATGELRWERRYAAATTGRTGSHSRTVASTAPPTRGVRARRGDRARVWRRRLATATSSSSTSRRSSRTGRVHRDIGLPPGGRGAVYAFDATTGDVTLEVRHDRRPWRIRRGGRRRHLEPVVGRSRPRVSGTANPGSVGRIARAAERRRVPGPRALHGLARRARRRARGGCSGTTR